MISKEIAGKADNSRASMVKRLALFPDTPEIAMAKMGTQQGIDQMALASTERDDKVNDVKSCIADSTRQQ